MGQLISEGHLCDAPSGQTVGALYRCDCGLLHVMQVGGWHACSMLEEPLVMLNHQMSQARRARYKADS